MFANNLTFVECLSTYKRSTKFETFLLVCVWSIKLFFSIVNRRPENHYVNRILDLRTAKTEFKRNVKIPKYNEMVHNNQMFEQVI